MCCSVIDFYLEFNIVIWEIIKTSIIQRIQYYKYRIKRMPAFFIYSELYTERNFGERIAEIEADG